MYGSCSKLWLAFFNIYVKWCLQWWAVYKAYRSNLPNKLIMLWNHLESMNHAYICLLHYLNLGNGAIKCSKNWRIRHSDSIIWTKNWSVIRFYWLLKSFKYRIRENLLEPIINRNKLKKSVWHEKNNKYIIFNEK